MKEKTLILISITVLLMASGFIWGYARAETATWQAPLVHYLDLEGPKMYESEMIPAEGTITGITANWDFLGKVRLEVSANNGKDYTPILNGVPQDRGFLPGEQLRYRAFLAPQSKLKKVTLSFSDTQGTKQTFGNPQLSGFQFRKAIDIMNSSEAELFNYQVKIEVIEAGLHVAGNTSHVEDKKDNGVSCDGHIEADFKDIRFTAADGETLLPFYLESVTGKPGARLATFWVKIPQLPRGENPIRIYLYYGNKDAQGLSTGEGVFDFYEDFSEKELNPEKWEVFNELKGETSIVDSQLRLKNSAIFSRNFKLQDGIIEFKATVEGAYAIQGVVRDKKEGAFYSTIGQTVYSSGFTGAEHTIAVGNMVKVNIGNPISPQRSYVYRVIAEGSNLTFERYNAETGEKEAELRFADVGGLAEGYIGLKGECASADTGAVYCDWIRVRAYAAAKPLVTYIGKEEETNLAQFLGTTLSSEGRLVLNGGSTAGRYISKTIVSDFPVRIMRAESDYPLNLSADRGKTYKKGVENKKYYYASLGDFAEGKYLKWEMELLSENKKETERISLDYYPGTLTLISPNGGEEFKTDSLQEILWSAQEYERRYPLKLEYSLDKGRTYKTITNETANTGNFYWRVPGKALTQDAMLKISDAKAGEIYDVSNAVFSIVESEK